MFDSFDDWLDPGFRVHVSGTEYRVQSPPAVVVLDLHRALADPDRASRSTRDELERIRPLLGDAWDQLNRDGVAELSLLHLGRTLIANYAASRDIAVSYWTTGTFDTPPTTPPVDDFTCACKNACGGELTCKPGTYGPLDPGGGPYKPETGDRDWYLRFDQAPALAANKPATRKVITWPDILDCWVHLEADFHDVYTVDLDTDILRRRSWRWFEVRVGALIQSPQSRLRRALDTRKDDHGNDSR